MKLLDFKGWDELDYGKVSPDDIEFFNHNFGGFSTHVDSNGYTPLHRVIQFNGGLENVEKIIEMGVPVDVGDKMGWTPLHWSLKTGYNLDIVRALLDAGANPNGVTEAGSSCLEFAVRYFAYPKVLIELIKFGADVAGSVSYFGYSILHVAATCCVDIAVFKLLIDAGADPLAETPDGNTASSMCHGQPAIRDFLVEAEKKCSKGLETIKLPPKQSEFDALRKLNIDEWHKVSIDLLKNLIDHGFDVCEPCKGGFHPIHAASFPDVPSELIRVLISAGADLECRRPPYGTTPLMISVSLGNYGAFLALMEAGVDVEAVDCDGWTAAHWAALRHRKGMLIGLWEAGADLRAVSDSGCTPIGSALKYPEMQGFIFALLSKQAA